jgi:curved DNA-binding protein CbpA
MKNIEKNGREPENVGGNSEKATRKRSGKGGKGGKGGTRKNGSGQSKGRGKKKKRKKGDKERILRERPDDIRRAAWMQMGLSAKDYADIINGAIGLDHSSVSQLTQKILGATTNDKKDLKSAYRQKVNAYHPDRSTGPSFTAEYELITEEKMKIVQNFYEKLKKAGIAS